MIVDLDREVFRGNEFEGALGARASFDEANPCSHEKSFSCSKEFGTEGMSSWGGESLAGSDDLFETLESSSELASDSVPRGSAVREISSRCLERWLVTFLRPVPVFSKHNWHSRVSQLGAKWCSVPR